MKKICLALYHVYHVCHVYFMENVGLNALERTMAFPWLFVTYWRVSQSFVWFLSNQFLIFVQIELLPVCVGRNKHNTFLILMLQPDYAQCSTCELLWSAWICTNSVQHVVQSSILVSPWFVRLCKLLTVFSCASR